MPICTLIMVNVTLLLLQCLFFKQRALLSLCIRLQVSTAEWTRSISHLPGKVSQLEWARKRRRCWLVMWSDISVFSPSLTSPGLTIPGLSPRVPAETNLLFPLLHFQLCPSFSVSTSLVLICSPWNLKDPQSSKSEHSALYWWLLAPHQEPLLLLVCTEVRQLSISLVGSEYQPFSALLPCQSMLQSSVFCTGGVD